MITNNKNNFLLPASNELKPCRKQHPNNPQALLRRKPKSYRLQKPSLSVAGQMQGDVKDAFHLPDAVPREKPFFEYLCSSERYKKTPDFFSIPEREEGVRGSKNLIANLKEAILNNYASENARSRRLKPFRAGIKDQDRKLPKIRSAEEPQLGMAELLITKIPLAISKQPTPRGVPCAEAERSGKRRHSPEPVKYKVAGV